RKTEAKPSRNRPRHQQGHLRVLRRPVLAERRAQVICHGQQPRQSSNRIQHGPGPSRTQAPSYEERFLWLTAGKRERGGSSRPVQTVEDSADDQFGTATLVLGGNAALVLMPRSRSNAICSALSSLVSGGT